MTTVLERLAGKCDEIVALTQALIRFPTINPPGEAYQPCAEFLGRRLSGHGFAVNYVRAAGTPGDSERYPRINVIARREGGAARTERAFQQPYRCGAGRRRLDPRSLRRGGPRRQSLWQRGLRHEGRTRRVHRRGRSPGRLGIKLPGTLEISGTVDEESGGFGGVPYLAQRGWFSPPRVDHVIIPEPLNVDRVCIGHRGVWWAEIETQGRIAHGSMPFLGDCAVRHMNAFIDRWSGSYIRACGTAHRHARGSLRCAASTLNINSIHGGQAEDHPVIRRPVCRIRAAW